MYMEKRYLEEVGQVTLRILKIYNAMVDEVEDVSILSDNQILNALFPASILVTLLAMMNESLKSMKSKKGIVFAEFEPFLRCFYWLCYYSCSVQDIESHPDAFPLLSKEVRRLHGDNFAQQIQRLKDLLQSFEGCDTKDVPGRLSFRRVYSTDYHLEKYLRDVGGHASRIAHIDGVSLVIVYTTSLLWLIWFVAALRLLARLSTMRNFVRALKGQINIHYPAQKVTRLMVQLVTV